uniref:Laminin, alpha 2 n=1 Tax=Oncorhynchus mykiss TaxID=8022 RepID=A0A8C7WGA9_ONCMY
QMCSSGHRRVNSSVFKGGCTDHTTGFHCDECIPGFHGVANKRTPNDCQPCACPLNIPSNNPTCHVDPRGELICDRWQPGYMGAHCDRCTNGYFGQPVVKGRLCQPCQCNGNLDLASPRSCDPITGSCLSLKCGKRSQSSRGPNTFARHCICHPNTIPGCCSVANAFCQSACGCNQVGSMTQQCNPNTGCCLCLEQSHGKKCSECRLGYRDFPQCISCICNMAGSNIQTCDADQDVCACVDRTGQCSCKANIQGLKCDRCKLGTFGVSTRNPLGCSQCYCFGMTSNCSEAQGLIRMWLSLKPEQTKLPLVDRDNQQETTRGVTFQHPEIIANADLVTQKLTKTYYWRLPEQFQASMITAYGGKLKYAIYFEERDETGRTSYEPQVIIKGVSNRNKVMVRHMQGLQIGQPTRHEINMTEVRTWKYKDKNVMTMEDFMDVLFYVDYVLIQSSHGNMMRHSRISMEVAEEGRPSMESEWAHQVEKCDCPLGYSRLSCEECVAGLYRLSARSGGAASRADIGSCVVNGWECGTDISVSSLQNCQHNTEGDRCECFAPGYYGVLRGRPGDCKPCACPLTKHENNFSPSSVTEGLNDYHCVACPEGHLSTLNMVFAPLDVPRVTTATSVPQAGPQPCDLRSGQCRCRPGATGRTCSQCMKRHVCGPSGIMCTYTNMTY